MEITPEFVTGTAGIAVSLVLSYWPGLRVKFAALNPDYKRLILLATLLLVSASTIGLACSGLAADFGLAVTCDRPGVVSVLISFFMAALGSQLAYDLTPKAADVRQVIERQKDESAYSTGYDHGYEDARG